MQTQTQTQTLPLRLRQCGRLHCSLLLLPLESSSHQQRRLHCLLWERSMRRGEVETERREQRDEPADSEPLPLRSFR